MVLRILEQGRLGCEDFDEVAQVSKWSSLGKKAELPRNVVPHIVERGSSEKKSMLIAQAASSSVEDRVLRLGILRGIWRVGWQRKIL